MLVQIENVCSAVISSARSSFKVIDGGTSSILGVSSLSRESQEARKTLFLLLLQCSTAILRGVGLLCHQHHTRSPVSLSPLHCFIVSVILGNMDILNERICTETMFVLDSHNWIGSNPQSKSMVSLRPPEKVMVEIESALHPPSDRKHAVCHICIAKIKSDIDRHAIFGTGD